MSKERKQFVKNLTIYSSGEPDIGISGEEITITTDHQIDEKNREETRKEFLELGEELTGVPAKFLAVRFFDEENQAQKLQSKINKTLSVKKFKE